MGEVVVSVLQLFWEYPGFMLRVLLGVVVAGVAWLVLLRLRDRFRMWWDLRTRGWAVEPRDEDVEYREVVGGRLERLRFRTRSERNDPATTIVYVFIPRLVRWDEASPGWARRRWEEIVERMRSRLPVETFELKFE